MHFRPEGADDLIHAAYLLSSELLSVRENRGKKFLKLEFIVNSRPEVAV